MKEYILTEKENIVAIADAIRNKTGSAEKLALGEFVENINGITSGSNSSNTVTINVSVIEKYGTSFYYFSSNGICEHVYLDYYSNPSITINAIGGILLSSFNPIEGNYISVTGVYPSNYAYITNYLIYFSPNTIDSYVVLSGDPAEAEIPLE